MKGVFKKYNLSSLLSLLFMVSVITVLFQNCAPFEVSEQGSLSSSSGSGLVSFKSEFGQEAKAVLVKHCAACHGITSGGSGGLSDILNLNHIIDLGLVVPGNPKASRMFQAVTSGVMPKGSKLSEVEIATLGHWIRGLDTRSGKCLPEAIQKMQNPQVRTWRLTKAQVLNSLKDVFGRAYSAGPILPDDVAFMGFVNDPESLRVKEQYARKIKSFAEKVALAAAAEAVEQVNTDNLSRVRGYFWSKTRALFRRPATTSELDTYMELFEMGSTAKEGLQLSLQAMLQSPHFWYRRELGASSSHKQYEIASRLSFTIWNSTPDNTLLDLAKTGELDQASVIREQINRMLATEKGKEFLVRFVEEWFEINTVRGRSIDVGAGEKSTVGTSMAEEARRFISNVMEKQDARLESLFTSNKTFINKDLAPLYQTTISNDNFNEHEMDGSTRSGILTLPGVIAAISAGGTPYIKRGVFIRSKLLCQPFPAPPDAEIDESKMDMEPKTPREIAAIHSKNPACKTCHAMIDPIGFGMSKYDEYGLFSPFNDSTTVFNDKAELRLTVNVDGDYDGVIPLSHALGKSKDLQLCSSEKMFQFMFGRQVEDADRCEVSMVNDRFEKSGYNLKELAKAFLESNLFIKRGQ